MLRSSASRVAARQVSKRGVCTMTTRLASSSRPMSVSFVQKSGSKVCVNVPVTSSQARLFSGKTLPPHQVLAMPALSPTMETGTISSWEKKVGEQVRAGDMLANVETDKAVVSFDSTEDGYIAKILVNANGGQIAVGTPVAIMVDDAADVAAFADYEVGAAPAAPATPATPAPATPAPATPAPVAAAPVAAAPAASPTSNGNRLFITPAARILAGERGIDVSALTGTGASGNVIPVVVCADVQEFQKPCPVAAPASTTVATPAAAKPAVAAASAVSGDYTDEPLTAMRSTIAKRLTESKQSIPHYYVTVEIDMTQVNKFRANLNKTLAEQAAATKTDAVKLSVNDFVIKACAAALRKVPQVNASWQGTAIRKYDYVDVSVAVSTDAGLITPIIADADLKGLSAISNNMKALAKKARANKLAPEEFIGGTFTVSNLGMFGVKHFTSIINPPQAGILAVGASEDKVVKNAAYTPENGQFPFTTVSVMNVTASFDHRVVDGAVGAQWLAAFKEYMENPVKLLL